MPVPAGQHVCFRFDSLNGFEDHASHLMPAPFTVETDQISGGPMHVILGEGANLSCSAGRDGGAGPASGICDFSGYRVDVS